MYQKRVKMENTILWMVDLACLMISISIAFALRFHYFLGSRSHGNQLWQVALMCLLLIVVNVFFNFNRNFFRRSFLDELINVVGEQVCFCTSWIVFLYLMHRTNDLARMVVIYYALINVCLDTGARMLLKMYLVKVYKQSKYSSRLLLIAESGKAEETIQNLLSYNEWSRILKGVVLVDAEAKGRTICGFPVVADKANAMRFAIRNDIDEVFIDVSNIREKPEIQEWIRQMEQMGIIVDVNIDIFDLCSMGKRSLNRVGKYAVVTFARNIFSAREMVAKRTLDVLGATVGMAILGVSFLFIAPLIKLESPGPVFFKQVRIGKNGRKFTFYKYRSMYQDAEERKKALMEQNEVSGLMFKMKEDPRITKVGRLLRKTSMDELPQFFNVIKGDMSLVGTRPPTVDEFERYEAKHKCRLSMTPGLTGLWQISGRSDITDFEEVVGLDMEYIDNWSILLDIKIILRTVGVVLAGKGSR